MREIPRRMAGSPRFVVECRAVRPIRARIDPSALRHNLGVVKRRAARSRVWAVVKANAYGHGLARAARALAAADGLALIELEAALELRGGGERRPILLLQGFYSPQEIDLISANALATVVHDAEQLAMLEKAPASAKIPVYLKLNTGMNRLGFAGGEVRGALARLGQQGLAAVEREYNWQRDGARLLDVVERAGGGEQISAPRALAERDDPRRRIAGRS